MGKQTAQAKEVYYRNIVEPNILSKRVVGPTVLGYVALKCYHRLTGALHLREARIAVNWQFYFRNFGIKRDRRYIFSS